MQRKKRKIIHIIIAGITFIVLLLSFVAFSFSRIVPSHAVERAAIISDYGSTITIDGFDIWYNLLNESSPNSPIIVIAGGSGFSSDYIEGSLEFLAEEHPVLFFDARGCGRSQIKPDLSNYSIDKMSDELGILKRVFFLDKKVIVLAHSFGGVIAMNYAANNESDIEKMILISSADTNYKTHYTDAFFKAGLPPRDQEEANQWYMDHIDIFFGRYFAVEEAKSIFDKTVTSYAVSAHVGGKSFDITDRIKNNSIPTLILVGGEREYPLTSITVAQHLDDLFIDSVLINLPDSGHFMFAEKTDDFQRIIHEWIDKVK